MHRTKPKMLVRIALLAAISIILGKFLAFNIGDWFRFSFENLPLLFCGYLFGVPSGILCAVVADLVGCLVRGYSINPIITLGAAALGAAAGCFGKKGFCKTPRLSLSVAVGHLVGSVILKSVGIHVFYATPYAALLWRLPSYAAVALLEYTVIRILLNSKGFANILEK